MGMERFYYDIYQYWFIIKLNIQCDNVVFTCTPPPHTSPSLCVSARPMESAPAHLRHPD